jgi:hypothetical protein
MPLYLYKENLFVYNNYMAEIKTKVTNASVVDFINAIDNKLKKKEGLVILKLFKTITGEKPKMWGLSIIGFGQYHYKSERSSQEGDWLLTGFSPRKQALTLYVLCGFDGQGGLLKKLGKHKTGKGCLYINKLSDVDMNVLESIVKKSFAWMKKKYQDKSTTSSVKKNRVYTMSFAGVYPCYVTKAEKKGRTKKEVDEIILWLTGYTQKKFEAQLKKKSDMENFFANAPKLNPSRRLISGVICGVRIEEITDPLMKEIRYLDKLIDELAKGRPMEKILRK